MCFLCGVLFGVVWCCFLCECLCDSVFVRGLFIIACLCVVVCDCSYDVVCCLGNLLWLCLAVCFFVYVCVWLVIHCVMFVRFAFAFVLCVCACASVVFACLCDRCCLSMCVRALIVIFCVVL